jgi:hypothetical protein
MTLISLVTLITLLIEAALTARVTLAFLVILITCIIPISLVILITHVFLLPSLTSPENSHAGHSEHRLNLSDLPVPALETKALYLWSCYHAERKLLAQLGRS